MKEEIHKCFQPKTNDALMEQLLFLISFFYVVFIFQCCFIAPAEVLVFLVHVHY
jgi:hypothetical protein